VATIKP